MSGGGGGAYLGTGLCREVVSPPDILKCNCSSLESADLLNPSGHQVLPRVREGVRV